MRQPNYNHLFYFYTVAKEGSVTSAAKRLHVTPQTVSGQLATFESHIGAPLFERRAKRLQTNELGKITLRYAEDIFSLGSELAATLRKPGGNKLTTFNVGVVDALPKVLAFEMLNHCFDMHPRFSLNCHMGDLKGLLKDLAINKLDLIISDQALPTGLSVKATSRLLGESGISFFAANSIAKNIAEEFPASISKQNFLMPGRNSALWQNLNNWFELHNNYPETVAEFDDSALLKFFGQQGRGVFALSSAAEPDVLEQFDVAVIGRSNSVIERYYSITPQRKIKHPAVNEVVAMARELLLSRSC